MFLKYSRNRKGQSSQVYLFFLLFILVPVIFLFGMPLLSSAGAHGMATSGSTGVIGLILDNMHIVIFLVFLFFIIMWVKS